MHDARNLGIVVKTYPKLSETFILEEILGLERQAIEVEIFSFQHPTDDRSHGEVAAVKAPVHYRPSIGVSLVASHLRAAAYHPVRYARAFLGAARRRELGWWTGFQTAGWLASRARTDNVGWFHSHFLTDPSVATEIASQMTGIEFSMSGHAKDIYLSDPGTLARLLGSAAFSTTCTDHNRDFLTAIAPPGATIYSNHHGVDIDLFTPSPERGNRPIVLAVGRLREKKGFDLLVEACAHLRNEGREFECRIVGYGPCESEVKDQIKHLGLGDTVRLLGKLTRNEVIDQYRQATMVVQPCRVTADGDRDGIPNVLLEAMAMGLPVVTTSVSGIPELVGHDYSGLVVDENNALELASAIGGLIDEPQRAAVLGDAARATIETSFSTVQSIERLSAHLATHMRSDRIAYIVKGYPRLSELFIANEISRVERLGQPIRLFVLKPADEEARHSIVGEVISDPEYLPAMTSISKRPALVWLGENLPAYGSTLLGSAVRSPKGFALAVRDAGAQSLRARKGRWPRKLYLKEFFQATAIANAILSDPSVGHIHAHFAHGATTVAWLAATISGRTFSFTAHAKDIYRQDLNPAGLLGRKLAAATFAATCTEANRKHLATLRPDADIRTIYHGLNEEFSRMVDWTAKPNSHDDGPFRLLAVGRLVPKKGLDLLIGAAALLREQGIDVLVRIVGEKGEHAPSLRELVRSLGLAASVEFVGPMNQEQLFGEYRAAHAFVLPCRILDDGDRDGIPNVMMEAMAAGLPVISTSISGIPELIEDRRSGLLVPSETGSAVAKAILELHSDPEMARRIALAGRETVRTQYDGWATTRQLVDLFAGDSGP